MKFSSLLFFLIILHLSLTERLLASDSLHLYSNLTGRQLSDPEFEKSLTLPGRSWSFNTDLEKYQWSGKKKAGKALRSIVPIGVGIALIFVSGPAGCIPVGVGVVMGVKGLSDSYKNKKTRSLLRGALLFLTGHDRSQNPDYKSSLNDFQNFYLSVSKSLREHLWSESSDWQLESYLASRLLLINHYGFLVANRFNYDPEVQHLSNSTEADSRGLFSVKFLKQQIVPLCLIMEDTLLVTDIPTLERISFGIRLP